MTAGLVAGIVTLCAGLVADMPGLVLVDAVLTQLCPVVVAVRGLAGVLRGMKHSRGADSPETGRGPGAAR